MSAEDPKGNGAYTGPGDGEELELELEPLHEFPRLGSQHDTPPLGVARGALAAGSSVESFIGAIADKVHERMGPPPAPPAPPTPPTFLGISQGGWTKMIITLLCAATAAIFAWYLSVRDGLDEARKHRHPALEQEVRVIRESQIRQEIISAEQGATLIRIEERLNRDHKAGD